MGDISQYEQKRIDNIVAKHISFLDKAKEEEKRIIFKKDELESRYKIMYTHRKNLGIE